MDTCATSGTVSTRGYGKKFNATGIDTNVWFKFNLTQNPSMKDNIKNVTFHAKIQRVKSIDVPEIRESLLVNGVQKYGIPYELKDNPPQERIIELKRKISLDSLKEMDQKMPGLTLSWKYQGASKIDGSNCKWADGNKGFVRFNITLYR